MEHSPANTDRTRIQLEANVQEGRAWGGVGERLGRLGAVEEEAFQSREARGKRQLEAVVSYNPRV